MLWESIVFVGETHVPQGVFTFSQWACIEVCEILVGKVIPFIIRIEKCGKAVGFFSAFAEKWLYTKFLVYALLCYVAHHLFNLCRFVKQSPSEVIQLLITESTKLDGKLTMFNNGQ